MFKPADGRVLIKPDEAETTTASGIVLVDSAVEKPMTGVVVSTNSDSFPKDSRILFSRYGYDEVKLDGILHYIVSDMSILGIYE